MKKTLYQLMLALLFILAGQNVAAQQRRPIDSQHPMWMVHVDVWNSADPQKIIDLIPADIRPFVCMNLSLSCQYDTKTNMYRMPRCAVRTYKSLASVCQNNNMWFTCQPASGGHTHIQDDDLATFEYFFKTYPNFLGWNYAEQFWGFAEAGDKSSSTQASRIALFAKLVPMHHKYGGVLTISFCGNIWSHALNPMGMMKRNTELLKACKDYPEAVLWLYKYTTSSCFYNNESVTFGPFVSGLAKNYGVRYDNCGYNGALGALLGEGHGKKYPGSAGIGTVMEQTCVNGGAVWDGPELIWTEDFQNLSNSNVDGYTRRNWGTFGNMKGVWIDMFRQIVKGNLYIPSREEVVGKLKIAIQNDVNSGSDEQKYAAWGSLYDGLYKQDDPFNRGNGQWMDNFWYLKKSGRYGTIPLVIGFYDDAAKAIPVKKKKSAVMSSWSTKVSEFNAQYPEVSTGDLYVNRYRNQLVVYTPYTYLNAKKWASARIPLQYNTCDELRLNFGKLSSGYVREYADHIDFYLNNYRSDSTEVQVDTITVVGVEGTPSYKFTKPATGATDHTVSFVKSFDEAAKTFTLAVKHMGPVNVTLTCAGTAERTATDVLPQGALEQPKQPEAFVGPVVIEAENMDYKSVQNVALTHSGWWAQDYSEFASMGYVEMGTNTASSLRHQLKKVAGGDYDIYIRYCNTSKAGKLQVILNGTTQYVDIEKVSKNDWRKAKLSVKLNETNNDLYINNKGGIGMTIDQIIYMPAGMPAEKFMVTVNSNEHGTVTTDKAEAAEGETVTLRVNCDAGYKLKELRIVNSVYFTMAKTIAVTDPNNITFVMPDDNVTLQPVFEDAAAIYKLDFADVLSGTLPPGWRCLQENNTVREYPNKYGDGARVFEGFVGHQGKALYWRNNCAEYGRQTAYPLSLQPGQYQLSFAMAAWKGTPKYKVSILNATTGKSVAASDVMTATPNANGFTTANLTSAKNQELAFSISEAGKYIISFTDQTGAAGYTEFLLLECRLAPVVPVDIAVVTATGSGMPAGIYSLSGTRLSKMQRGINIVVGADGKARRVMVK